MSTLQEWWPDGREDAEARLDALVRKNRFTISVFFPLNGVILLLASATVPAVPDWLAFNGTLILLGTLVMRSPLIAGVAPVADRRAVAGIGLLALYAYGIEFLGVHTGWPYGTFKYGVDLGPTVAGVPLGLPVFFLPLVANAYLLSLLLLGDRASDPVTRLAAVVSLVLAMDVVLDPGAVGLGFWRYPGVANGGALAVLSGGGFYGVPLSNYAGWVLSATVAVVALDLSFDRAALRRRLADCEFMLDDMVSFVILWGGVNAAFGNVLPALVAAGIGLGLIRTNRFDASLLRP